MKHVETIQAYIKTLMASGNFHALVVQSPPGWGKSTTIDLALSDLKADAVSAGSYATPLHIYNTLCRHADSIIVLDDCAGLFSDPKSMAILKAATWASSGQAPDREARRVAWGSTSDKVERPFVDFSGKLILLTNVVPAGKETEAFLSRCLSYRISLGDSEIKQMLLSAADSSTHFAKPSLALDVARFIIADGTSADFSKVNLRTLKLGYDLAVTHPNHWRELFLQLLPRESEPTDLIRHLMTAGLSAKEQETKFIAATGKSRRSYYHYKKQLGLTRFYRVQITGRDSASTKARSKSPR